MRFAVRRDTDDVSVIPADMLASVARGRIDRRLFDLTTLAEFGYDRRDTVPLIVTGQGAGRAATRGRALPSVNGAAYDVAKGAAWNSLTRDRGVSTVWLDGRRKAVLDHSAPQIGAPSAWAAGYTGAGATVAVLDTGVDQTHPDLADREIAEANFSDSPGNQDHVGHGTHVASIIAGTGAKSGGKYRGVAAGASILDGKVLDDDGYGQDSAIIAGMEWAVAQGADIVNLSLGGDDAPGVDPLEEAVNTLSAEHGALFVIAAGNDGPAVSSPGSADAALTVGAVDRDDQLAWFSNPGPRVGDGAIKPDVTAPGVNIVAALHSDGTIGQEVEPGYTALSGTSMATPHVAGAAALLAQQHPDYTGQQLKALLSATAKPTPGLTAFQQGAGRVDITRAIIQQIVTEPTNVSIGTVAWPHDDDTPVGKTLTYRNLGDADVTLALTIDSDAPAGMFSLSANEVIVPAGGTAEVTVSGDTRVSDIDGIFTGAVVATAGDTVTRTPVGLDREVESYTLTIDMLDATGAPTADYRAFLLNMDGSSYQYPYDDDGSIELRLPKGTYLFDSTIYDTVDGLPHMNFIVRPKVVLDKDTRITADARAAKPISVTPPVDATLRFADIGYTLPGGGGATFVINELRELSIAGLGEPLPGTTFTVGISTHWKAADGSYYGLVWFPHGTMPTGFTKAPRPGEFATVRMKLGSSAPGRTGEPGLWQAPSAGEAFVIGAGNPETPLPGTWTAHVTTDGVLWQSSLTQLHEGNAESEHSTPYRAYRPGRTHDVPLNHSVFGPTIADDWTSGGIFRIGNLVRVSPSLFSDGAGNEGYSAGVSGSLALYRDGELVGESPYPGGAFEVPAGDAEYRAVVTATRPAASFDVSTAVTAEWTFRSAYVDDETPTPVSASVVRFAPKLDDANSAKAGARFVVPVSLHRDGAVERPSTLTVDVSYDEGRTWQRATTVLNLAVVLTHPAGATSVSLRATATSRGGDTVTQTIIRAYTLRT
jgi:hypothetical protein